MNPINNSDTAWLIVSDYNQDNDLPFEDLREDILNPETNKWEMEYAPLGDGVCGLDNMDLSIYGSMFPGDHVHGAINGQVGDQRADMCGYGQFSSRVGGIHESN